MSNHPEQVSIPIDNTQSTGGNVLLGVVYHHVKNAFKDKYGLEWVVIRHLPKGMICGGGINAINQNEPPKTKMRTWPTTTQAYGITLPESSSSKNSHVHL